MIGFRNPVSSYWDQYWEIWRSLVYIQTLFQLFINIILSKAIKAVFNIPFTNQFIKRFYILFTRWDAKEFIKSYRKLSVSDKSNLFSYNSITNHCSHDCYMSIDQAKSWSHKTILNNLLKTPSSSKLFWFRYSVN